MLLTKNIETMYQKLEQTYNPSTAKQALAAEIPCSKTEQLHKFTKQLVRTTQASYPVLLAARTYTIRYFSSPAQFSESDDLIHFRLAFLSLLVAYKYINERAVANTAWQKASQELFTLEEVNAMERMFLSMVRFDLRVEDSETQAEWANLLDKLVKSKRDTPDAMFIMTPVTTVHEGMGSQSTHEGDSRSLVGSFGNRKSALSLKSTGTISGKWTAFWKSIRGSVEVI
ncbi:hypothetical protein HDU79_005918 [Rhizoclosmatium sp. JEL0117]|nr:hypothetical protein HDU79_005918 [Rhizoclosmatium sp. JEL0117]